jgi:pimeloyl-ACP methyl ester carboxylesterase
MATFVFVAGAWHAGWCWERLVPLLTNAKHRVLTPDLLGTGADKTPLAEITLARWADQIADLLRSEPEPVILVGHSRGGIVISEVAERVPDLIRCLVFVAAGLVQDGDSLLAASRRLVPDFGTDIVTMWPDGTYTINRDVVQPKLYNKTEMEWVERALARLQPDPTNTLTECLHLSEDRFGSVPRSYIATIQDGVVPIDMQRAMLQQMPCNPVITLDTDHCAFYSDPKGLSEALLSIVVA